MSTKFTYRATEDGRILSVDSNWRGYGERELRQHIHNDGYLCVRIIVDGRRIRRKVHQLVAEAFHGARPTLEHEVRHLNGDPLDNRADNLAWGTRSDNAKDRVSHGRQFIPPWGDPEFRAKAIKGMRNATRARA